MISRFRLITAPFFLLLLSFGQVYGASLLRVIDFCVAQGDNPQWAAPAYQDSDWKMIPIYALPNPQGILWLRARIELRPENIEKQHPVGLLIAGLSSNEIYWDGELIGRSGTPAAIPADENPGRIQAHFVVPERLANPGE